MGYIQIPKLIGGSDEPVIDVREMPQDWQYFKTLKESANDQAYLMFKGKSNSFTLSNLKTGSTVTIYGGSNGTTPLYQYRYSTTSSQRKWYHWNGTQWVINATQGTSTQNTNCKLTYADLTNYPLPWGLSLDKLTGKQITNDEHLGTTELFTIIVHSTTPSESNFVSDSFYGGTAASGAFSIPVVAYSGYSKGIKTSNTNINIQDLEFVEILGGTSINNYEFQNDYYLGKVVIPNTVTTLGQSVFMQAQNVQEIELSSGMTELPVCSFQYCYNLKKLKIKEGITTIGNYAFDNCWSLESLALPSTLTSIGIWSLANNSIKKIEIPSDVTYIDYEFMRNSQVEEVEFLGTTLDIEEGAFLNCSKLKKITLPSGLVNIPDEFCNQCYSLEEINFPSTLETIGHDAFFKTKIKEAILPEGLLVKDYNAFKECNNLEKVVLPNTLTLLGGNAFENDFLLKSINIPASILNIDAYAFSNCINLSELNIPEGITTLSESCFYKCVSLRKLELPSTLTTIQAASFSTCGNALYFKLKSITPPTLSNANAFTSCNTYMKILVPYNSISSYKTATNWSSSTNSIAARQRGYGTFQQGNTLPTTVGNYTLTWFENLNDILKTAASGVPTVTPITTAPYDGEFYCTIAQEER